MHQLGPKRQFYLIEKEPDGASHHLKPLSAGNYEKALKDWVCLIGGAVPIVTMCLVLVITFYVEMATIAVKY